MIWKCKNTLPWTYVINDPNDKEIVGTFFEKELQKTNQKEFQIEKLIQREGDAFYVRWKGYYNLLNSWIDKKKHSIKDWIFSKTKILRSKCESWIRSI